MTSASILAIDLGSSSLRVALVDDEARVVRMARRPHAFRDDAARGVDPHEVAASLLSALDELGGRGVETVVMSSLWHSVLGVDASDEPVTRVFTWESTEPDAVVPQLAELLESERYRARTGSYLHASYPLAGIRLLREQGADPARWSDLPGWLVRTVFGVETGWSSQLAAGSAMWHQAHDAWDAETLDAVGVPEARLGEVWREPVVLGAAAPAGLAGARLLPVLGDGYCDSRGIGAVGVDVSALTAATSGSLRMILDGVIQDAPFGIWRYRVGPHTMGLGGAISNAGNLLEWVRGTLGVDDPLAFAYADDPPPWDGLTALPELAGERGPRYRREASAAISGLRGRHTAHDIGRELVFGAIGAYASMTELMARAQPTLSRFVTAGGIVQGSPVFGQLLADATERTVSLSSVAESSLRGAAVHALGGAPAPEIVREFVPRAAWSAAIRERRAAAAQLDSRIRD
jgi:gluconokinase